MVLFLGGPDKGFSILFGLIVRNISRVVAFLFFNHVSAQYFMRVFHDKVALLRGLFGFISSFGAAATDVLFGFAFFLF